MKNVNNSSNLDKQQRFWEAYRGAVDENGKYSIVRVDDLR